MELTRDDLLKGAGILVTALVVFFTWNYHTPTPAPIGETTVAKEDKRVDNTPKEIIQPKKGVEVYVPAAKGTLNLPPDKQSDPKTHVTSATTVKPDEHPQTVITLLNEDTGETEVVQQRMEYPWLAAEQTGEVRLSYGFKNGGTKVGKLSGHEDLVQVKGVHIGADVHLETDGAYFVGGGVAWKW